MSEWLFEGKHIDDTDIDGFIGFVYIICNLTNNRKYIGKKLLKFTRTKTIKGKKKKVKIDSDWLTYYGSNDELLEDVNKLGKENFKREIFRFCKTKGECSYFEAQLQFEHGALLSDSYYNSWISCKIHKKHLKL